MTTHRYQHPAEEWSDEHGDYRTCSNCWASLPEGELHESGTCSEPGRCGGCGRLGPYGKPCFRPCYEEHGQLEECGQFV